jgi:hypothetical protein
MSDPVYFAIEKMRRSRDFRIGQRDMAGTDAINSLMGLLVASRSVTCKESGRPYRPQLPKTPI